MRWLSMSSRTWTIWQISSGLSWISQESLSLTTWGKKTPRTLLITLMKPTHLAFWKERRYFSKAPQLLLPQLSPRILKTYLTIPLSIFTSRRHNLPSPSLYPYLNLIRLSNSIKLCSLFIAQHQSQSNRGETSFPSFKKASLRKKKKTWAVGLRKLRVSSRESRKGSRVRILNSEIETGVLVKWRSGKGIL